MIGFALAAVIQLDTLSLPTPKGSATDYTQQTVYALPTTQVNPESVKSSAQQNIQPRGVEVGTSLQAGVNSLTSVYTASPEQLLAELQQSNSRNDTSLIDAVQVLTGRPNTPGIIDRVALFSSGAPLAEMSESSVDAVHVTQTECSTGTLQFTKNLALGAEDDEVINMQRFLNSHIETRVAERGTGSPGNETTHFGQKTQDAVTRFQAMYAARILAPLGFTTPTGVWGTATRAQANSLVCLAPH